MTTFELVIAYVNSFGDHITYVIPYFETMDHCQYWQDYFTRILENHNGADVKVSSCTIQYPEVK